MIQLSTFHLCLIFLISHFSFSFEEEASWVLTTTHSLLYLLQELKEIHHSFFCRLVQLTCSDLTPQSTEALDQIKLMAFFYYDIQTHGIKTEKCSIRIFTCCNAGNRNLWMLRSITGFRLSEKPSWLTVRAVNEGISSLKPILPSKAKAHINVSAWRHKLGSHTQNIMDGKIPFVFRIPWYISSIKQNFKESN